MAHRHTPTLRRLAWERLWRILLAPPGSYTIEDTWYTTGLRGTGSNDYVANDLFVPYEHSFSFREPKREGTLWARADSLLKTSSTLARDAGLRVPEPLKMTSIIDSPRSSLALLSPSTQRTASMMLDLPQPLGPTTPTRWPGSWKLVGSAKDLNPESLIELSRMNGAAPAVHVGERCQSARRAASSRRSALMYANVLIYMNFPSDIGSAASTPADAGKGPG